VKGRTKRLVRRHDDGSKLVANLLVALREDAGVSQSVWGARLGVSQRLIVNWEQRYRIPSRAQAYDLIVQLRDSDSDAELTLALAKCFGIHEDIVGLGVVDETPAASPDDVRARLSAAIYEAAEDHGVTPTALRGAVVAVLEAAASTRATVDEARAAVASLRTRKAAPKT
jgi:transcriptional regulator with XRE-family HTH domain